MLKIVRILFQSTVKRFAFDQSEDKCFRHQSIEKVIFPQGGISFGDDETLAFDATNRIDSRSFFQRNFMRHGNARIDFHFTYLEISIGDFRPVIGTVRAFAASLTFLPARTSPTKSVPLFRAMFPRAFAPVLIKGMALLARLRNKPPKPYPTCQGLPLNTGMPRPCC